MIKARQEIRMRRDRRGLSSLNQQGAVRSLMLSSSVVVINFSEKELVFSVQ